MTRRSTIVAFGLSFLLIFLITLVVMRGTVKKQSSVPNEVGTVEPALSNRPGFWIEFVLIHLAERLVGVLLRTNKRRFASYARLQIT